MKCVDCWREYQRSERGVIEKAQYVVQGKSVCASHLAEAEKE